MTAAERSTCWRSECGKGCYYPAACSVTAAERPAGEGLAESERRVLQNVDQQLRSFVMSGAACTVRVEAGEWTTVEGYVERIVAARVAAAEQAGARAVVERVEVVLERSFELRRSSPVSPVPGLTGTIEVVTADDLRAALRAALGDEQGKTAASP